MAAKKKTVFVRTTDEAALKGALALNGITDARVTVSKTGSHVELDTEQAETLLKGGTLDLGDGKSTKVEATNQKSPEPVVLQPGPRTSGRVIGRRDVEKAKEAEEEKEKLTRQVQGLERKVSGLERERAELTKSLQGVRHTLQRKQEEERRALEGAEKFWGEHAKSYVARNGASVLLGYSAQINGRPLQVEDITPEHLALVVGTPLVTANTVAQLRVFLQKQVEDSEPGKDRASAERSVQVFEKDLADNIRKDIAAKKIAETAAANASTLKTTIGDAVAAKHGKDDKAKPDRKTPAQAPTTETPSPSAAPQ